MFEVTMYQCEHCMKRVYKHNSSAKSHERKCYWNPETKSCMTCRRYKQPEVNDMMKVVGEDTFCYFAKENGLNYKCNAWIENVEF